MYKILAIIFIYTLFSTKPFAAGGWLESSKPFAGYPNSEIIWHTGGNLGIGAEPSAFPGHLFQLSNIDNHSALLINNFNSAAYTNGIIMQKSRSGVQDTFGATQNNDTLGFIHFKGANSSAFKLSASIDVIQKNSVGSFGAPSKLTLKTVNSDGAAWNNDQLVLSPSGNIGIGIEAPSEKLQLNGPIDTYFSVTGDNQTYVNLGRADHNAGILALYQNNELKIRLDPRTINNKSSFINAGNFGLGTNTPLYKLHVDAGDTGGDTDFARIGQVSRFLDFGVRGTNHSLSLQAKHNNGSTDVFNLILNPDGGNVSIGTSVESTHALNVNGVVNAKDVRVNNVSVISTISKANANSASILGIQSNLSATNSSVVSVTNGLSALENTVSQANNSTNNTLANIQANLNQNNSDIIYNTNTTQTISNVTQHLSQDNGFTGVGTSSPTQKLDVNGNIHASASIIASEDIVAKKYIKVGLTSDYPPNSDCAEFAHYGRMKVDPYTPSLFICTKYGWMRR